MNCPECGSDQIVMERRPDGDSQCTACGFKTKSRLWPKTSDQVELAWQEVASCINRMRDALELIARIEPHPPEPLSRAAMSGGLATLMMGYIRERGGQLIDHMKLPEVHKMPVATHKMGIRCCARCGEDHSDLEVFALLGHVPMPHTHYTMCPVTRQPVLVQIEEGM